MSSSAFCCCSLLILTALLLAALPVKKVVADTLDQNGGSSVEALQNDLKTQKRHIVAAGSISSKLTLFLSGANGQSDGVQVTVDSEAADGKFKLGSVQQQSNLKSSGVMFAATDSSGGCLVTMSSSEIDVISMGSGASSPTNIKGHDLVICYSAGSNYLSSSESVTFYLVEADGKFSKNNFDSSDIKSSQTCNSKPLGKMCVSGDKITISKECTGSPPASISAGVVSGSTVYLFTSTNEVYHFPSSVVESGSSATLTKVSSDIAWGEPLPPTEDPNHHDHDGGGGGGGGGAGPVTVFFCILIVLCTITGIGTAIYFICQHEKKMNSEDGKKKDGSGKRNKSSQKVGSGQKNQSSQKDGSSAGNCCGGGGGGSGQKNKSSQKKSSKGGGGGGSKRGGHSNRKNSRSKSKSQASSKSKQKKQQQQSSRKPSVAQSSAAVSKKKPSSGKIGK